MTLLGGGCVFCFAGYGSGAAEDIFDDSKLRAIRLEALGGQILETQLLLPDIIMQP